jgi:uncharacterized protein YndB with AHSA1/START domain
MDTRKHIHEEEFSATAEDLFKILHTPSAICEWWGASRAIVIPEAGGIWSAAWGDEDAPDYISIFTIAEFDPPRRILFADGKYHAKSGRPPFEMNMTTEFTVENAPGGSLLRVVQDGFPADPIADDFYAACDSGWRNTFAGIRNYLSKMRNLS